MFGSTSSAASRHPQGGRSAPSPAAASPPRQGSSGNPPPPPQRPSPPSSAGSRRSSSGGGKNLPVAGHRGRGRLASINQQGGTAAAAEQAAAASKSKEFQVLELEAAEDTQRTKVSQDEGLSWVAIYNTFLRQKLYFRLRLGDRCPLPQPPAAPFDVTTQTPTQGILDSAGELQRQLRLAQVADVEASVRGYLEATEEKLRIRYLASYVCRSSVLLQDLPRRKNSLLLQEAILERVLPELVAFATEVNEEWYDEPDAMEDWDITPAMWEDPFLTSPTAATATKPSAPAKAGAGGGWGSGSGASGRPLSPSSPTAASRQRFPAPPPPSTPPSVSAMSVGEKAVYFTFLHTSLHAEQAKLRARVEDTELRGRQALEQRLRRTAAGRVGAIEAAAASENLPLLARESRPAREARQAYQVAQLWLARMDVLQSLETQETLSRKSLVEGFFRFANWVTKIPPSVLVYNEKLF